MFEMLGTNIVQPVKLTRSSEPLSFARQKQYWMCWLSYGITQSLTHTFNSKRTFDPFIFTLKLPVQTIPCSVYWSLWLTMLLKSQRLKETLFRSNVKLSKMGGRPWPLKYHRGQWWAFTEAKSLILNLSSGGHRTGTNLANRNKPSHQRKPSVKHFD